MKNHATNPAARRLRRHGEARLEREARLEEQRRRPTERQIAVLAAYVAEGSVKGAAARLGLAEVTVTWHLVNIRAKVGAATTAQAIYALRDQLTPIENHG